MFYLLCRLKFAGACSGPQQRTVDCPKWHTLLVYKSSKSLYHGLLFDKVCKYCFKVRLHLQSWYGIHMQLVSENEKLKTNYLPNNTCSYVFQLKTKFLKMRKVSSVEKFISKCEDPKYEKKNQLKASFQFFMTHSKFIL